MAKDKKLTDEKVESMSAHVKELRSTLIYCLAAIILFAILGYCLFLDEIMLVFTNPLDKLGFSLVYTTVAESFTTQLKLSMLAGLVAASPVVFFFIWRFVAPALYPNERRTLMKFLPAVVGLFLAGVSFCYFVVFPYALHFFLITTAGDITPMLKVSDYVKFLYTFLLPFGMIFELPLIVSLLVKIGIVDVPKLQKSRKYVLFAIVVVAAIITPPDVFSQIALSIPVYGLYEVSIVMAKVSEKKKIAKEKAEAESLYDTASESEAEDEQ